MVGQVRIGIGSPRVAQKASATKSPKNFRSPRAMPAQLVLAKRVVDQIYEREREVRAHAREILCARPDTTQELVWLTTRTRTLGAGEPTIDPNDRRPALHVLDTDTVIVEPTQVHRVPLPVCALAEHPDRIDVLIGDRETHHAALVLGALPDGLKFPGRAELASAPLERTGMIADVVIHARWPANAAALKGTGHTILNADNATSEQASTGRVGDTRLATKLDAALAYKRSCLPALLPEPLSVVLSSAPRRAGITSLHSRRSAVPSRSLRRRYP
jgi:hypothetical protein